MSKFNGSGYLVKSQSAVLNFCHLTSFFCHHHFIGGSSKETKIVMGLLNSNVPEGRSVVHNMIGFGAQIIQKRL